MKRIGILTDAEQNSGLGHAKRVLALSTILINAGIRADIIISEDSKEHFFRGLNYVTKIDFNNNNERLIQIICNRNIQLLIIDTYLLEKSSVVNIAEALPNLPILVFDDFGEKIAWPIAGFINTGLGHSLIPYPGRSKIYSAFGLDYYPIPQDLIEFKMGSLDQEKKNQILLVMGGGDQEKQTIRILRILIQLNQYLSTNIKIVLGPFYENPEEIICVAENYFKNIEVIIDPENFYQYLMESDFVISGCGTIVYELIYLGVNFSALGLSENQRPTLRSLSDHGMSLGYFSEVSDKEIAQAIKRLLSRKSDDFLGSYTNNMKSSSNGGQLLALRLIEIYKRYKGTYFSTEDTAMDYQLAFSSVNNYEKVKWGSEESMNNQFTLGLSLIKSICNKTWLDVGCGTGDILRFTHIFESAPSKFTGLDLSKELITYAINNSPQYSGSVNFYNQNFTEQVDGEPFDLITCFGVLQKSGLGLYEAINRLSSLLCREGILLVSTKNLDWSAFDSPTFEPFSGHCWFSINQLKGAFESSNLEIVIIKGFDALQNKYVEINKSHSIFIVGKKR